jgi:CheY-like chemotaxis protein
MYVQAIDRSEKAVEWGRVAEEGPPGKLETILLVEDQAFVREVTGEVLRSAGYEVLTAKDAGEAMNLYDQRNGEVELLLTDVVLPGETGRELASKLRRNNPALSILLVSGYAEQMGPREGNEEECLAKPFTKELLLRTVRQRLDRQRIRLGVKN